jgi:hypothetical protein
MGSMHAAPVFSLAARENPDAKRLMFSILSEFDLN